MHIHSLLTLLPYTACHLYHDTQVVDQVCREEGALEHLDQEQCLHFFFEVYHHCSLTQSRYAVCVVCVCVREREREREKERERREYEKYMYVQ